MQFKLAVMCLLFCSSSLIVAQSPACPTGTMADVVGTTCTIGNLSFTFTTDFQGTSTTNAGPELITTSAAPANVAFIPVNSATQTGFMLKPLFAVDPVTQRLFFKVNFRYTTQVMGSYEITSETVSVAGNVAQTVSSEIAAFDQECYPDGSCTVADPIVSFNFVDVSGLFSDPSVTATLNIPSLGIPSPGTSFISSRGFDTDLPRFDSASFMYTVVPQAPLPPPARYTFATIDLPGVPNSGVIGLNNRAKVVGQYTDLDGNSHAYVSDGTSFTTIDPPGSTYALAASINDSGDIVGQYLDSANVSHGFLLTAGNFVVLDFPGAIETAAFGINNLGQIVGNYVTADAFGHGFLWENGIFTAIDAPVSQYPEQNTTLFCINDQKEITGAALDQNFIEHSFVLSHGFFRPLNVPGATITQVGCLNDSDVVIGMYQDVARNVHGFIREHNVFNTLDPPNVTYSFPSGINSSGHVVGGFGDAAGNDHSFIGQRIPGPQ